MFTNSSKYRSRAMLACLLIFNLSLAPIGLKWTAGLDNSAADSKQILLTCLSAGASSVPIVVRERTRLDSVYNLLAVFCEPAYSIFIGNSFSAFPADSSAAINLANDSIIPIRAPPFFHSSAS